MFFAVVSSPVRILRVTAAPLEAPLLAAVVAVGAASDPEAVVAVGAALPLELGTGLGVSAVLPHAESIMLRATATAATCRRIRLVAFLAISFLLGN
jgi:hypothetical protein